MPILSNKNTIPCVRSFKNLISPPAPKPGGDGIIQESGLEPIYILLETGSNADFIIQE